MATTPSKTILVTGAIGKQGSALIDALLAADGSGKAWSIVAVTRDPAFRSAQASGDRGGAGKKIRKWSDLRENFAAKFNIEKPLQKLAATSPQQTIYTILR